MTQALLDIDMREVQALQRELRAVSKDFANAMQNELRAPVQDFARELKLSASVNLGRHGKDAASTIRATSSSRSGYSVKREDNERFTQGGYSDRTGGIRHPLFGNRNYWYHTPKSSALHWWSKVVDDRIPVYTEEFTEALLRILNRLATGNLSTTSLSIGKRTKSVL